MATEINAGRVAMVPKGEWTSTTAYTRLDVVLYNGSSWVAIQDGTGQVPADGSTYWQILARGVDITNYYTKAQVDAKIAASSPVRVRATWNASTSAYVSEASVDTMYQSFYTDGKVLELHLVNGNWNGLVLACRGGHTDGNVRHMVFGGVGMGMIVYADVVGTAVTVVYDSIVDIWDELGGKQDTLVSGTSIKTVNGVSLLGGGNVDVSEVEVVSFSHVSGSVDDFVADKSVDDIYNAYYAKKLVVGVMQGSGEDLMFVLANCDPDSDLYLFVSLQTNYTVTLEWLGVDEYTFRRESTVFATLSQLAGKQDVSPITNAASGALVVNEYRDFGTVSALTVTLTGGTMANYDLYKFAFTCASDSTTLTLPSGIKLPVDMEMEMATGRRFECVIDYANCLTFNCWD